MTAPATLPRRWFRRHPVIALAAVDLVLLLLAAVCLEAMFRHQWVDFWGAELRRYNPALPARPAVTVLMLGDSFTAGRNALADHVRRRLGDDVLVVNSAVSGATARDAALMAPRRLARFRPRVTVYQVFVGNDLFETRHVAEPDQAPRLRRLYWSLLDRGWWSLGWVNYKLGQTRDALLRARYGDLDDLEKVAREHEELDARRSFDPAAYRARDRDLAAAAPRAIADQVRVAGPMATVWPVWAADIRRLATAVEGAGSRLVVVVIPHCVQVAPLYHHRFTALGAELGDPEALARTPQVMVEKLRALLPGVEVLDPLAAMQAAEARGVRLYRTHDPHLASDGQQLVAELLAAGALADLAAAARRQTTAAGTATASSVATVAQAAPSAP